MKELYRKALENLASIATTCGGGKLGYTALGMTPQFYAMLSNTPWANPVDPRELVYPMGASGEMMKRMDMEHGKKREWLEMQAVATAIKNQVLEEIEEPFYKALKHPYLGYKDITAGQLLDHLLTTYAKITDAGRAGGGQGNYEDTIQSRRTTQNGV